MDWGDISQGNLSAFPGYPQVIQPYSGLIHRLNHPFDAFNLTGFLPVLHFESQ
jgi:hypothetical protein